MTMSEVLAAVNELNPNAFEEETKGKIVCALESRLLHRFTGEEKAFTYPEDMNTELYLPERYAEVYILYLSAMLYFWNKEYEEYNNHVSLYNAMLDEYEREYASTKVTERKRFFNLY